MDAKETWLVNATVDAIASGNFHERDVLLREYAAGNTPLREFGDFVAHRERDRGILLQVRERIRGALLGQTNTTENLPIWSVAQIGDSLNVTFARLGVPSLDPENVNRVTVSVMTLLQGVRLGQNQFDHLGIEMSSHYILLQAYGKLPAGHIVSSLCSSRRTTAMRRHYVCSWWTIRFDATTSWRASLLMASFVWRVGHPPSNSRAAPDVDPRHGIRKRYHAFRTGLRR